MTPPRPCPKDDDEPDLAFSAANLLAVVLEIVRAGTQPAPPAHHGGPDERD